MTDPVPSAGRTGRPPVRVLVADDHPVFRRGLIGLLRALDAAAITPTHVQLREPTLDEVFLHLTDRPTTRDGGHR